MSAARTYPHGSCPPRGRRGHAERACTPREQAGLTVLELLLAIALIGLMMALALSGLRYLRSSDLRGETAEVVSVLRAAANMATTTGAHHRVVFDLDQQTYRIETCEGEIKLRRTDKEEVAEAPPEDALYRPGVDTSIPPEIRDALSPEEAAKAAAALVGTRLGDATCRPPVLPTGDSDARGHVRTVDAGVKIKRMFVQHLEGEQIDGVVHVNFFPLGHAEKAFVELADPDGTEFAVLLHGLTGRIELKSERVDPDDHMLRRADGEKMDER